MENLSHSRHPNRPVPSLSKKACNGGSGLGSGPSKAAATTKYNEFSGGPPRFGAPTQSPCLEDYCEVFGGVIASRAAVSSIPMLDLPLVDDRDVYFDVRSPGFDYREVFGGFDDFDFAPSYEELLMDRSEVGEDDSSDEAWTPAEMESLSGETEHAGKSPCFTNGRDSYESIDGSTTEFNISYNVTGQISYSNMFSGVTHVAGLGSVPGYTFAIDEMEYAGETTKLKKKSQSFLVRGDTSGYPFGNEGRNQKHYGRAVSFPSEPFVTVSDIDLKTKPSEVPPPSRPPPLLKRDSSSSASNCRTTVSGGSADCNSPSFFDAEADTSSAAVREVMEKAKATVKSAEEVLEGKKDGARITVKPSPANERMTEEGKLSVDNMNLPVDWPEVEKNNNVSKKSSEDKHGRKSLPMQGSARFDGNDEWKEATQFFELVRTEEPRNADESSSGNDVFLHRNAEFPEQNQTRATKSDVEKLKERRAVGDMGKHEVEKLLKNYGTTEVAFDRESHEKMRLPEKVLQEGMEEKLRNVVMHAEAENKLPDHGGSEKHENLLKFDREGNRLLVDKHAEQKKELHYEEINNHIEKEQEYVFEWEHSARKLREALGLADNESMVEMSLEPNEDRKKSRMADGMDVNEKKLKKALEEQIEDENRMKEAREKEENERRVSEALEKAENEKRVKAALEQEKKERTLREEQQSKDAFEKEEKNRRMKEAHEKAEQETKLKLACEEEEHKGKVREAHEKVELERRQKEALEQEQTERHLKEVQEREENERRAKEALEKAEREKRLKQEREENDKKLEEAMELEEKERNLREASEGAENDERLKEAHEQEEMARRQMDAKEREESENDEKQDDCRGQEDKARLEEVTEKASGKEFLRGSLGETKREDEGGDSHETLYEVPAEEDDPGQKEIRDRPDETCSWKDFENKLKDASQEEGLEENDGEKTSQKAAAEEERVKNVAVDGVDCDQRDMEESRFTSNPGNNESKLDHQQEEQGSSYHTLAGLNQDVNPEKPLPSRVIKDFVDTTRKEAVQNNASQSTRNNSRNLDEVFAQQRKKEAERIKRERELQMEQLRKTEEEREREREKDGMAFDHRALTDARERLEKACVEAREKSLPPVGAASRYQNPSACAGTVGESPRRYVSRLERHRRTAERVAKALEEKNMRDLVAQREQAERNRLAETLDAEVKRWSSGKEGNIRALLSTLQYVLGHESGWQPIPLTEVITSAAVKKAYRKATLCVHPDKLQQRGANVQQKYISEKVFDLLKVNISMSPVFTFILGVESWVWVYPRVLEIRVPVARATARSNVWRREQSRIPVPSTDYPYRGGERVSWQGAEMQKEGGEDCEGQGGGEISF